MSGRFREDDIRIGYVSGVFGLKGELRLYVYNLASDLLGQRSKIYLVNQQGERKAVSLSVRSGSGKRVLGRIEEIGTVDDAQVLVGQEMVLPRDELPEPEEGAWYHCDLLGARVQTESGEFLGRLDEIHSAGEADVWVVRGDGPERYIPVLKDIVVSVDPGQLVVVLDGTGSVLE